MNELGDVEIDEDFRDFIDYVLWPNRIPKRYVRDGHNPLEWWNETEFKKRYRFDKDTIINVILPLVAIPLQRQSQRGLPITPLLQLLTCLRFYATASFQVVCGDLISLSQPTVSRIVKNVSRLLALQHINLITLPTTAAATFECKAAFQRLGTIGNVQGIPGIVGAVDGTHVRIVNIPGRPPHLEVFRNRKTYFSINVQVIAGPNLEFMDIVARYAGSTHDSTMFRTSRVYVRFLNGEIQGSLLGDAAYACTRFLFTPVRNVQNEAEERYNRAHKRARNIVERAFGIWKRRFPCLKRGLGNSLTTVSYIIVACAVLHNIGLCVNDEAPHDNEIDLPPEEPIPEDPRPEEPIQGIAARQTLIENHFGRLR